MEEALVREVVEKKNAIYKPNTDLSEVRLGDNVQVQAEGNRIYQIQILR
jgi:hypothetical protein